MFLSGAGARVTATARGEEGLRSLVREAGANVVAVAGDVGDDADARRMVEGAVAAHGGVDVLVNNAAIIALPAPVVRIPAQTWAEVLRVNVIGTANMVRHALPVMDRRGRGVIVNLSSGWGRVGERDVAPYCVSKFGVEALTQSLADEVGNGIVVFALNPGVVDTDMLRSAWGDGASRYPKPEALDGRWKHLFERVEPSWNGRSLDLDDFRR
jgi:NAD(P)-dependent dehydrogenase (short-subunit alcohol dehydrogenase family)